MSNFWKLAPYAAGGIGLSALENKVLGSELPDPLKKINLGIGATQGIMMGLPGSKAKMLALGSIPTKQMGLFALGEAEKFKNQQEALTDTNLNTAKVNESAAKLHLRDAGTSRAIQLAFLLPALVGAGALGYGAYNQFKKEHKPKSKFKNLEETGEHKPNQRLRLEMPISALPDDFVPSLLSARDKAHIRVQRKKAASFLGTAGNLALDFTGLPELLRGGKDLMHGFGSLQDSDYGDAARYTGSGLGNLALGVVDARFGAPLFGKILGKARLGGVMRNALKGESKQLTEMPTAARYLYRHTFLPEKWVDRNPLHQYDPVKFDWHSPTTSSGLFRSFLTSPAAGSGPKSMLGNLGMGAKYVGNRAVNAGYATRQLMRRWPTVTLMAAGMPLASRGTERDEMEAAQDKALWDRFRPSGDNFGPQGMPVSSVANSIIRAMSGSAEPIAGQLSGR